MKDRCQIRDLRAAARAHGDAPACSDAAGPRDALNPRIVDDAIGLVKRNGQVGVGSDRGAGVERQFIVRDRSSRHDPGMFYNEGVIGHQMWTGDPRELSV